MGNLTRDPEIKHTPKGTAVAQLGVAINRKWKADNGQMNEETTFVDCEAWGRTAELAGEYLRKGSNVYLDGRLKLDSWEDKQSGQKRSKLKVVVENMQFLDRPEKSEHAERDGRRQELRDRVQTQRAPSPKPAQDPDGDDIPF